MTLALFVGMSLERFFFSSGKDRSELAHNWACLWGQSVFFLNPGWKVTVYDRHNLPEKGNSTVLVANHKSAMDICALFATGIPFRWLSKKLVFKLPLVGQAMRWAGYVPIDRGNPNSHKEALEASMNWLKKGVPMLYFPEGTRSESNELRPFKMGAFNIAEQQQVAITPLVIVGTEKLMKKSSIMVQGVAHVSIKVLSPMNPEPGEKLAEFKDRVRELIQQHANQMNAMEGSSSVVGQNTATTKGV